MSDVNFIDAESDYKSENTSFREIVMRHVERIAKLSAFELYHGGHYEHRPSGHTEIQVWVPDGKDVYCNCVQALTDMLFAFFDNEMIEAENQFDKEMKENLHRNTKPDANDETIRTFSDSGQHLYKRARYTAHTKLFRALCSFLRRKRFLDVGTIEE